MLFAVANLVLHCHYAWKRKLGTTVRALERAQKCYIKFARVCISWRGSAAADLAELGL